MGSNTEREYPGKNDLGVSLIANFCGTSHHRIDLKPEEIDNKKTSTVHSAGIPPGSFTGEPACSGSGSTKTAPSWRPLGSEWVRNPTNFWDVLSGCFYSKNKLYAIWSKLKILHLRSYIVFRGVFPIQSITFEFHDVPLHLGHLDKALTCKVGRPQRPQRMGRDGCFY